MRVINVNSKKTKKYRMDCVQFDLYFNCKNNIIKDAINNLIYGISYFKEKIESQYNNILGYNNYDKDKIILDIKPWNIKKNYKCVNKTTKQKNGTLETKEYLDDGYEATCYIKLVLPLLNNCSYRIVYDLAYSINSLRSIKYSFVMSDKEYEKIQTELRKELLEDNCKQTNEILCNYHLKNSDNHLYASSINHIDYHNEKENHINGINFKTTKIGNDDSMCNEILDNTIIDLLITPENSPFKIFMDNISVTWDILEGC